MKRSRLALAGALGTIVFAAVAGLAQPRRVGTQAIRVPPPPPRRDVSSIASSLGAPPSVADNRPAARRSPATLVAPARRPVVVSSSARSAAAVRAQRYQLAERAAPPAVKAKVAQMRARLQGHGFQVGVTAVSQKDLHTITGGLSRPPDVHALAMSKVQRAQAVHKDNLVRSQMIARAALPPRLAAAEAARRNPGDGAAAGPTSQGTNQSGQGAGAFPSSANPSPTSAAFSWRDRMTPIKDQGDCGSCWAFATTAVMEANEVLYDSASPTLDLAEQQLVNCAPNPFSSAANSNCNGNSPESVWKYLSATPDALESSVPYKGVMQACNASAGTPPYTVKDWAYVGESDVVNPTVAEIKAAIIAHGPVAASVDATDAFQSYTGGVFDEGATGDTNHVIVLTGWDDSQGAWYLRNSWSSGWGEDGYMWIKYGSNSVGQWASWAQPLTNAPAPVPTFGDRYLSVENDAGETLDVFVQGELAGGQWVPATPGQGAAAFTYTVLAGQTLDVKRTDTGAYLTATAARVWATSTDGKRTWTQFQNTNFSMASAPYQATERGRSTFHFNPLAQPAAPSAGTLFAQAAAARQAHDYAGAEADYAKFVGQFPDDAHIHEARFWLGWAQYEQQKFPPATTSLSHMIRAAPEGQAFLPFAFYFLGLSEAGEGDCGYAERNLEVVAYGEIDAPAAWVNASRSEIGTLNNDDGTICQNWD